MEPRLSIRMSGQGFFLFVSLCLFLLAFGGGAGCDEAKKMEPGQSDTATNETKSESKQYMAVCTTRVEHEGNEYILTRWVDSKDKALVYGREHSRKKKGHVVIYRERDKP